MNTKVSQSSSSQQKQQGSIHSIKKQDDKLSYSNDTSNSTSGAADTAKKMKKSYQHRHVIADAAKYGSTTDSASMNDNSSRGSDGGDDFKGDGDYESGKAATRGVGGGATGGKSSAKSGGSRYQEDIMSVSALDKWNKSGNNDEDLDDFDDF